MQGKRCGCCDDCCSPFPVWCDAWGDAPAEALEERARKEASYRRAQPPAVPKPGLSDSAHRALDLLSEEIGEVVKVSPISDEGGRFLIVDAEPAFPFIIHPGWDLVSGEFDGDTRTYTFRRTP